MGAGVLKYLSDALDRRRWFLGDVIFGDLVVFSTPLKFNIASKNIPKGNSSSNHYFSGAMLNFGGVGEILTGFETKKWLEQNFGGVDAYL